MKIEIEFTSSYSAKLTVDGREMSVESRPGVVELEGLEGPDSDETLGGLVAGAIYGLVADIQQAEAAASEIDVEIETWQKLSEEALDAVYDKLT